MNAELAKHLIQMKNDDLALREKLLADKSLFDGYNPKMQACHEKNAAELSKIIKKHGWPTEDMVGDKGAAAAWLIAQHAIGLPDFQRECYKYLDAAAQKGQVPKWQPAYMIDRIRSFEGRGQIYGTQVIWDENGVLNPQPIEDEAGVDQRRASVGLPPLAEALEKMRANDTGQNKPDCKNWRKRQKQAEDWAKSVGWRK